MTVKTKTKAISIKWDALTPAMIAPASISVGKTSETLQVRVHRILIAIAADWVATTDQQSAVERVNFLLDELADGLRKNAIVLWVTSPKHFGMLVKEVDVETAGKVKAVKVIAAGKMKAKNIDMLFLVNSHWWTFTKEPEFKAFDLQAKITALLVEADKVVKRDDKRQKTLPTSILAALREVEAMTATKPYKGKAKGKTVKA